MTILRAMTVAELKCVCTFISAFINCHTSSSEQYLQHNCVKPLSRWWGGCTRSGLTYLSLQVRGLVGRGPGQHPRVAEAGPQQGPQHKQKQSAAHHRDGWAQLESQERTAEQAGEDGGGGGDGGQRNRGGDNRLII